MSEKKEHLPYIASRQASLTTLAETKIAVAVSDLLALSKKNYRGRWKAAGGAEGYYEGDWGNEQPHGQRRMTFANGEVYEGEWREGKSCQVR